VTESAFAGLCIVIVGLARQGSALARFFCGAGAHVTVTDLRPAEDLGDALIALKGLPIRYALGGHPLSLLDSCDLVCLSGGVPPETPFPQEARRRGIPLSNDSLLTLDLIRALSVGVTGSSGKTTTTTLVGKMLEASGYRTWVGGNIGTPLIDRVSQIGASDRVVLELSSFQLQLFAEPGRRTHATPSPTVAAVLNVTPNHLDRHPSMAHYIASKANILRYGAQIAVLGVDDPVAGAWWHAGRVKVAAGEGQDAVSFLLPERRLGFSLVAELTEGAFLRDKRLIWRWEGREHAVCRADEICMLGRHNIANVLAACAISGVAGASPEAMREVAISFEGVAHRLELVREWRGVRWYNDSIATAPERVVAALRSFDQPVVLLAGGRDKHLPWDEMADLAIERVRHLVLFGEAADLIRGQIEAAWRRRGKRTALRVHRCDDLEQAVETAARVARPGDVVLLSPGGTSFDAYRDFEERGRHFGRLVNALDDKASAS